MPQIVVASSIAATMAHAQEFAGYSTFGSPGLIDMPSALSRPDAELSFTSSHFRNQTRNTVTFQITPRLSGSFRYTKLTDTTWFVGGPIVPVNFDRSFSLQYQFITETDRRPAVSVGLNDFLGTGVYSSEFLVATKSIGQRLRVTGGIGWGRLGSHGSFKNPLSVFSSKFEIRPGRDGGLGGEVESQNWFRGEAAFFGGIEWQASDRLSLIAEYSSDNYVIEHGSAFDRKSPINFGIRYRVRPNIVVAANYLYGSELGARVTLATNPKHPKGVAGFDRKAYPILPRASAEKLGWNLETVGERGLRQRVAKALDESGIRLHGMTVQSDTIRIEVENTLYTNTAQVIGRSARVLTHTVPASVDVYVIVPVASGLQGTAVTLRRDDLEALEHDYDGAWRSYARAEFSTGANPLSPSEERYPKFNWRVKPYLSPSLFDPDGPLRADFGAELSATYEPVLGLTFKGVLRKKLAGNLDDSSRPSNSILPHVRSDFNRYEAQGDPALTELIAAYNFPLGQDLYGRVTAGYLEPMFGGISAEVLWKPADSRFALGAEINYVKQRDFDQLFGFRNYEIATGHVSAYWDMNNGFHTQLDVGRYLAGDWGGTLTIDREFRNGWKVGVFATLTDVSFSDFGEGSFDKGLRFTIPISFVSGQPNTEKFSTTIRPVTRDGGARVNVSGRLYETIRGMQQPALKDGWGRFWK